MTLVALGIRQAWRLEVMILVDPTKEGPILDGGKTQMWEGGDVQAVCGDLWRSPPRLFQESGVWNFAACES